jgi:hypothetical protein
MSSYRFFNSDFEVFRAIPGRMRAELFKVSHFFFALASPFHFFLKKNILNCIAAWEEWALYPFDFLNTLKTAFTAAPIKNASVPATASPAGEPGWSSCAIFFLLPVELKGAHPPVEPIIQAHSAPVSSVDHVAPATALPGFKVVGSAEEEDIDGEDIVGSGYRSSVVVLISALIIISNLHRRYRRRRYRRRGFTI